jgi:hypothetical protein
MAETEAAKFLRKKNLFHDSIHEALLGDEIRTQVAEKLSFLGYQSGQNKILWKSIFFEPVRIIFCKCLCQAF